jgi:hypothetical protein
MDNNKIPIEKYRELDSFSKWRKKLEENGIYLDDELGTNLIVTLAKHINKNKTKKYEPVRLRLSKFIKRYFRKWY